MLQFLTHVNPAIRGVQPPDRKKLYMQNNVEKVWQYWGKWKQSAQNEEKEGKIGEEREKLGNNSKTKVLSPCPYLCMGLG